MADAEKRFRQVLYFRLNVVVLETPPLRERHDDILILAEHFLAVFCQRAHRKTLVISPAARQKLTAHSWPGNVRELRNLMERLAYLLTDDQIKVEDLAFILSSPGESPASLTSSSLRGPGAPGTSTTTSLFPSR